MATTIATCIHKLLSFQTLLALLRFTFIEIMHQLPCPLSGHWPWTTNTLFLRSPAPDEIQTYKGYSPKPLQDIQKNSWIILVKIKCEI